MARKNRTAAQLREAKAKRVKLSLQPNQEAFIDAEGRISIRSTDLRGKDNYGVVSQMRAVEARMNFKKPFLEAMDADYLMKQLMPRRFDRDSGVCLY